jgi:hypothetical protein
MPGHLYSDHQKQMLNFFTYQALKIAITDISKAIFSRAIIRLIL